MWNSIVKWMNKPPKPKESSPHPHDKQQKAKKKKKKGKKKKKQIANPENTHPERTNSENAIEEEKE